MKRDLKNFLIFVGLISFPYFLKLIAPQAQITTPQEKFVKNFYDKRAKQMRRWQEGKESILLEKDARDQEFLADSKRFKKLFEPNPNPQPNKIKETLDLFEKQMEEHFWNSISKPYTIDAYEEEQVKLGRKASDISFDELWKVAHDNFQEKIHSFRKESIEAKKLMKESWQEFKAQKQEEFRKNLDKFCEKEEAFFEKRHQDTLKKLESNDDEEIKK
jgi:hypothetical protein